GGQTPDIRTADADAARAVRQRLVDVGSVAEAAIHEDRNPPAHRLDDFGQALDGRTQRFGGTPAVVRDDDAVGAMFDREPRVFGAVETLEQELHLRQLLQPVDVLPRGFRGIGAGVAESLVHRAVDADTGPADVARDA